MFRTLGFDKNFGTREEVWAGLAYQTRGRLTKNDLRIGTRGRIVSVRKSDASKARYPNFRTRLNKTDIKMTRESFLEKVKELTGEEPSSVGVSYPIFSLLKLTDEEREKVVEDLRNHIEYYRTTVPTLENLRGSDDIFNAWVYLLMSHEMEMGDIDFTKIDTGKRILIVASVE